jgi:excisionase family DNA binding protein
MLQNRYISTKEASDALGFSRTHIIRLIKDGEIKAKKMDNQYLVDKNSIGVLKGITQYEISSVRSSSSFALKQYGDIIKKLGSE